MSAGLRFLHVSDTHFHHDPTYTKDYAPHSPYAGTLALLKAIRALPFTPDFVLHTGDIVYDPDPNSYEAIKALFSALPMPVYYLRGNHDDRDHLQKILFGRAEDSITTDLYYDFMANDVHVVCLDSNGPHIPENPSGSVSTEQLDWLDEICNRQDERRLVVAVHHNVIPVGSPWMDDWMRMENGEEFHAIVRQARDRLVGVFSGHIHQATHTLRDGVLYTTACSPWYQLTSFPMPEDKTYATDLLTPAGFNVVSIDGDTVQIRRHGLQIGS